MKNNIKVKVITIIIALITVVVSVVLLSGYVYKKKIIDTSVNDNKNSNIIDEPTKNPTQDFQEEKKNLKFYENKDYVYDADYVRNVKADSYTIYDVTYRARDIIVPYINIKSEYANKANLEIKSVFDQAIETFNEGVDTEIWYVDECNYKKHQLNNIISVLLTYGHGGTSVIHPKYYAYNININDGSGVSYEELYTLFGYNSKSIEEKVVQKITSIMKEKTSDFQDDYYPDDTDFNTYNRESILNYKTSVSNNTLEYFINDNGKLAIVVTLSIPIDTGEFDTIIELN